MEKKIDPTSFTTTSFSPTTFTLKQSALITIQGTGLTSGMTVSLQELEVQGLIWSPNPAFGTASPDGTTLQCSSTPALLSEKAIDVPFDPIQGELLVSVSDGSIISPTIPMVGPVLYIPGPVHITPGAES